MIVFEALSLMISFASLMVLAVATQKK